MTDWLTDCMYEKMTKWLTDWRTDWVFTLKFLLCLKQVASHSTPGWKPGNFGDWRKKGGTLGRRVVCQCPGQGEIKGKYLRCDLMYLAFRYNCLKQNLINSYVFLQQQNKKLLLPHNASHLNFSTWAGPSMLPRLTVMTITALVLSLVTKKL